MTEGIGVPLWEDYNGFLTRPSFAIKSWKPAGIYNIILWIRRAHRRSETQKLCRTQLSCPRHLLELLKLLLLPHVGGEELWQAFFEEEVGGRVIAEEAVAIRDDAPIQLGEVVFGT